MKEVAVIGAGIFGVSCALELGKHFNVTLFEKSDALLCGASFGNQNRFHYGYHYPRSDDTGKECLSSLSSFEASYGEAICRDLKNYYCVAKSNSKTTPQEYKDFCNRLGLRYEVEWPSTRYLNHGLIDLSLRVPEPIFDFYSLRKIVSQKLGESRTISLRLNASIVSARVAGQKKILTARSGESQSESEFDYVVNTTYKNLNEVSELFGFSNRSFQFELVEIPIITLPGNHRIGITVMDGPFCSILPFGHSKNTLLYHAAESLLDTRFSGKYTVADCIASKSDKIIEESSAFFPLLKAAKYLRSIIVVRTVDPSSEKDDARRSEITYHGSGCWSVFSAKIITACNIAVNLSSQMLDLDRGTE